MGRLRDLQSIFAVTSGSPSKKPEKNKWTKRKMKQIILLRDLEFEKGSDRDNNLIFRLKTMSFEIKCSYISWFYEALFKDFPINHFISFFGASQIRFSTKGNFLIMLAVQKRTILNKSSSIFYEGSSSMNLFFLRNTKPVLSQIWDDTESNQDLILRGIWIQ